MDKKKENNPDYPRLKVFVRDNDRFQTARLKPKKEQALALGLKNTSKNYKHIQKSQGFETFDNKIEAYIAGYKKLDSIHKKGPKAWMFGDNDKRNYSVYCMKLDTRVWANKDFRKANTHIADKLNKQSFSVSAYYVGQTHHSIKKRYCQHIKTKEEEKTSTEWGRNYFLRPFANALDQNLIQRFEKETGISTTGLLYGESLIIEHQLANWIRSNRNFGAYYG